MFFVGKETKRGVDYRIALIKVYLHCKANFPNHFITDALFTLCEMQRVLYSQESKRTSLLILHLYLMTFLHVMALKRFKKIKSNTERKFYGKYFHAISHHPPDQRVRNEKEENLIIQMVSLA